MIFEEKKKAVNPIRYTEDRKTLSRRISFKRLLAEDINTLIAVFNKESEVVRINNSVLVNIAMNCFLKQLEKLSEEEGLHYLEKKL